MSDKPNELHYNEILTVVRILNGMMDDHLIGKTGMTDEMNAKSEAARAPLSAVSSMIPVMPIAGEYGCHCDLQEGKPPTRCVVDTGLPDHCGIARTGIRKEKCEYWKVIK